MNCQPEWKRYTDLPRCLREDDLWGASQSGLPCTMININKSPNLQRGNDN